MSRESSMALPTYLPTPRQVTYDCSTEPLQTLPLSSENAEHLADVFSEVGTLLQNTAGVELSSNKLDNAVNALRSKGIGQAECKMETYMLMDAFCRQKNIDVERLGAAIGVIKQVCDALSKPSDALSESEAKSAIDQIRQILFPGADVNIDAIEK